MTTTSSHSYQSLSPAGFHTLRYTEWGTGDRVVVCVHGLTRNGRDFDKLAEALAAAGFRVVCPDVVGRGQSDWLPRPELYGYPQALADTAVLLAKLNARELFWVGTSMGGLMGLMLAAQPHTPLRKLVLNDVGPFIPKAALERLATYVGADPRFASLAEVEAYLRRVHAPFGNLSDDDWLAMAQHSNRQLPDGSYALAYDLAIAAAFKGPLTDLNLWPLWPMVQVPTLLLRGAQSDLLLAETAMQMTQLGPKPRLIEFAECGHAPALMSEAQIRPIVEFLSA